MTKTLSRSEPLTAPTDNTHDQCRLKVARPELADPPTWLDHLTMLIEDSVDHPIREVVVE